MTDFWLKHALGCRKLCFGFLELRHQKDGDRNGNLRKQLGDGEEADAEHRLLQIRRESDTFQRPASRVEKAAEDNKEAHLIDQEADDLIIPDVIIGRRTQQQELDAVDNERTKSDDDDDELIDQGQRLQQFPHDAP